MCSVSSDFQPPSFTDFSADYLLVNINVRVTEGIALHKLYPTVLVTCP